MATFRNDVYMAMTRELDDRGVPYTFEHRSRHRAIKFLGRTLTYSVNAKDRRAPLKAKMQVRKLLREEGILK